MNKANDLQFICPDDQTLLTTQRAGLVCPACGRTRRLTDGFYSFWNPSRLSPETQLAFHQHTDALPHLRLSAWHHFLSDMRSHLTNGFIHRRLQREVRAPERVIDLGCGNGFMRGLLSGNVTYVGVDFDPELLRRAACYHAALYLQAPVEAVPLADQQFDVVITTETLEHLPEPEALLREAHRLLYPGGRLLLSIPNEYCWKYRIKGHHRQHLVNFDLNLLRRMVSSYFEIGSIEQRGFWFPLPTGRHSFQVGWRMPAGLATNFIVFARKAP